MGVALANWHKSSIDFGFPLNLMVFEKPDWHKSSIDFGFSSNLMVFEKLTGTKLSIHIEALAKSDVEQAQKCQNGLHPFLILFISDGTR